MWLSGEREVGMSGFLEKGVTRAGPGARPPTPPFTAFSEASSEASSLTREHLSWSSLLD